MSTDNNTFKTRIKVKVPFDGETRLRFDDKKSLNTPGFCLNEDKEIDVELKIISETEFQKKIDMEIAYAARDENVNLTTLQAQDKKRYEYKIDKYEYLAHQEVKRRFISENDPRLKSIKS